MSERESVGQRCARCRYTFRVLADEDGMHDCPRCGPDVDVDDPLLEDEDEDDDEEDEDEAE